MTSRLGHFLRKKLYPTRTFDNYCIKRYERESKPPTYDPVSGEIRDPGTGMRAIKQHARGKLMVLEEATSFGYLPPPSSGPPRELCSKSCPERAHHHQAKKVRRPSACPSCGQHKSGFMVSTDTWSCEDSWHRPGPRTGEMRKPCRSCSGLRHAEETCKQMKFCCPTCGRTTRGFGRCMDNWHSGDCAIEYR